jgi:hypothetical protein
LISPDSTNVINVKKPFIADHRHTRARRVNEIRTVLLPSRVILRRLWVEEIRPQFKLALEHPRHSFFRPFVNQYQPYYGIPSSGDHNLFTPFSPFNETGQARFCTAYRCDKHAQILADGHAYGHTKSLGPQDVVDLLRKTHYEV